MPGHSLPGKSFMRPSPPESMPLQVKPNYAGISVAAWLENRIALERA